MRGSLVHVAALIALGCAFGVLPAACGKEQPKPALVECTVSAPTVCPEQPPHYADVEPTFARHCVDCHFGAPEGPWSLADYQNIADWSDTVRGDVLNCSMPPADAAVPSMSNVERVAILTWILCGYPP